MLPIKNETKFTNIIETGPHKSFPKHCFLRGKINKAYFYTFIFY